MGIKADKTSVQKTLSACCMHLPQQCSVPETSDAVFTCSQESVNPSCSMCATLPVYLEQRGYLGRRTFSAKT